MGDNLSEAERAALNDIRKWSDEIVRPYDKGKGFVVDTVENYRKRMYKELNNTEVYEKLDSTKVDSATHEINLLLELWNCEALDRKDINAAISKWMINTEATPGNIYQLYKAHKPEKGYPGRTIASVCGSPIENISKWVEYFIKPIAKKLDHRIEDTRHALEKIENLNKNPLFDAREVIHVSWDISAMFPNIDNEGGISACEHRLNEREIKTPSTYTIIEALKIVLTNNISKFESNVYRQIQGTAMGPSNSCSYADIAVDEKIDRKIMDDANLYFKFIPLWARFRDDIYCPWVGSVKDLLEFDKFLNSLDPKLNFEMKYSKGGIEFLDLFIYTEGNRIETRIYSKECDPHAYLLPSSYHPVHMIENIPFSVMTRVRRCSGEHSYQTAIQEYKTHLLKRDYADEIIDKAIDKANQTDRNDLIFNKKDPIDKENSARKYPLIMKYNAKLPNMNQIIRKHLPVLKLTPETSELFPEKSIFVSYKIEKNIRELITCSKFRSRDTHDQEINPDVKGCVKCNKCKLCKLYLEETKVAWSYHTNETFRLKSTLTCTTPNVIYAIHDKVCKLSYIGYTGDEDIHRRWANHKSHIKQNRKTCELASHFIKNSNSCHKLTRSDLKKYDEELQGQLGLVILEEVILPKNYDESTKTKCLEARENHWQCNLKAVQLYGGLNKRGS